MRPAARRSCVSADRRQRTGESWRGDLFACSAEAHTIAPVEPLLYRRAIPPISPNRLLRGKAGIARAVEHVDRRIGDLFRHAEALDQLDIGHEQGSACT